ncbi:MAG: flagellar basal body P-ring formation chaperone FlgA [Rhodoferax sp.]|nr:flagellar basal body P-ring formation chaperone FlgA [Rhodoferax sp.]
MLWALGFCGGGGVLAQGPAAPEKLLSEVGQWIQRSQQLDASQFSFAPLDSRVQLQTCDRPLVMDTPFASRETVRVRCLGNPNWQLYLRVLLKPGVAPGLALPAVPASSSPGPVAAPAAAAASRRVVVASQGLRAGSMVTRDLLRELDVPSQGLDAQVLTSIKDVENSELVRDVQPGVPIRSYDIRRAVVVKQGQSVMLTVGQGNGFSITARVEAMQDGKIGDQIRLKNPDSGRLLTGIVTGPNAARGL